MDKKVLLNQIQQLPLQEGVEIVDLILDSAASGQSPPPVSPEQLSELRARLEHHRLHPDEPGISLKEIRRKLTQR